MSKQLDLNQSVYHLVKQYPELKDILFELGFQDIIKPGMLHSFGKMMTIPKGAKVKGISMMDIVMKLMENDFELIGDMPMSMSSTKKEVVTVTDTDDRIDLLKSYLKRLNQGEELEDVQKDFIANFKDVDAMEIMQAEQTLIQEGAPIGEVQKLCDVHSSLFHGSTREEKIMNAEKAVVLSVQQKQLHDDAEERKAIADQYITMTGHPLSTFSKENTAISTLIGNIKEHMHDDMLDMYLPSLKDLSIHYAKKGDLLYPHLKVKYDISGPSDVMWTVDDEIRDAIRTLLKQDTRDPKWFMDLSNVLTRADEMIYKETNILFPICAEKFTEQEWVQIYFDSKDYAICLDVENEIWEAAIQSKPETSYTDEIVMPGGHMTVEQLTAMLNTIPLEISFVDQDNINRYFNEGPKVFKRPAMAIDREVFTCHPPKIEPMVRKIIDDFRSGARDKVEVWMEKEGKPFLVTYMAVRDTNQKYLGTMEIVQNMQFVKDHFGN